MASSDKQIQQMINFIDQEAKEKAREIEAQAEEEFTIEKQRLVKEEEGKIRREYERKEKQVLVQKKIANSNEIKAARLTVLKMRDEAMQEILAEAQRRINEVTKDQNAYKKLLKDLTIQGMLKLMEPNVNVYVRAVDKSLMQSVLKDCEKEYKQKTGKDCTLKISDTHLAANSAGGVTLGALEDRILCENTLERRLALCFEQQLPTIRRILFPFDHAAARQAAATKSHH
eukprot:GEZU01039211.1.p1 GENE.GEZU01039211.1~~GEZU01039211.1.p1  ORF type:complete len:229 (+),score=100.36 GEZU01039211.1:118-804(+)